MIYANLSQQFKAASLVIISWFLFLEEASPQAFDLEKCT